MAKIRTEISIESSESLIIRRKRYSVRTFCDKCSQISIMVLPTEAAFLACQDIDRVVSMMYKNQLHVRYIEKKGLYVCLTSLCLYRFENDFTESGFENSFLDADEPAEFLTGIKNRELKFVNEE